MPWVKREGGQITAISASQQPDMTEFLADDHADIIAFRAAQTAARDAFEARLAALNADAGYVDLVNRLKTSTPAQWQTYLNGQTTLAQMRTVIYRMGLALMALSRSLP